MCQIHDEWTGVYFYPSWLIQAADDLLGDPPMSVDDLLCGSSFNKSLALTRVDRIICSMTHVPYALKRSIYAINNATSHQDVSRALVRLRLHLVAGSSYNVIEHLYEVKWKEAIIRLSFFLL